MLSTALWVIEHQLAWSKKNFTPTRENEPFHFVTMPFYAVEAALISSSPYAGIATLSGKLSWHAQANAERTFMARTFGLNISKRQALKFGTTKVASRFVPYVGWGLLVYDLWNVGKWIGEKTS